MDNVFLNLREKKKNGKRSVLSAKDLSEEFANLGFNISVQSIGRLERNENPPSAEQLKAYSKRFNVTTDYLLGIPQHTINNEEDILLTMSNYSGLSSKSIKQLHNFAEERKEKHTGTFDFSSHYSLTINTIDFILSYYYDIYNNKQGYRGNDIFHFMGSYLIADNVELQTPNRFRYKYGSKFDDFKSGEKLITDSGEERVLDNFSVIGNDGKPFETNRLYFHEKTNPKNAHYLDFPELYRTHATNEIKKSLDDMLKHMSKKDTKNISATKKE